MTLLVDTASAPPDPELQLLTLVVSAVAAISGVISVFIGSKLSARQARSSWLREEQIRAYEDFAKTSWNGLNDILGGATQKALKSPQFEGLEDAKLIVESHTGKIVSSFHKIQVVGAKKSLAASTVFIQAWIDTCILAIPMPGAASIPAHLQHEEVADYLTIKLQFVVETMRRDLRLSSWLSYRNYRKRKVLDLGKVSPRIDTSALDQGAANRLLQDWGVRTFVPYDSSVGPVYTIDQLTHQAPDKIPIDTDQSLIGVLRKPKNAPWFLGISTDLPADRIDAVERDAVAIVTSNDYLPKTTLNDGRWIEGESEGEIIYWWVL